MLLLKNKHTKSKKKFLKSILGITLNFGETSRNERIPVSFL